MKRVGLLFSGVFLILLMSAPFVGAEKVKKKVKTPRNPFWPVGYEPAPEVVEKPKKVVNKNVVDLGLPEGVFSSAEVAAFRRTLAPSGIFAQGSKRFAIVQEDLLGEGDLTRVEYEGRKLRFRVKKIAAKSIVFRYEAPKAKPKLRVPTLRAAP